MHPCVCFNLVIERLLISGISPSSAPSGKADTFQSRYRAASHFRKAALQPSLDTHRCFNLVIERLLISGAPQSAHPSPIPMFQSRYRAASHFRLHGWGYLGRGYLSAGFNLVIERLLISGKRARRMRARFQVSISLSSGFSFQVLPKTFAGHMLQQFQSRYRAASHFRRQLPITSCGATLRFQSRYRAASHFRFLEVCAARSLLYVSISLSSGFSFQDNGNC